MKELVQQEKIALCGIIQEQHPERCRLFAQWHQFDWPILHDPINQIPTTAVPMVVAIDEHGIVRGMPRRPDWVINEFIGRTYPDPKRSNGPEKPNLKQLRKAAATQPTAANQRALAEAATIWGSVDTIDETIAAWEHALRLDPGNAALHFGRGVAMRMRFESRRRRDGDFQAAVDSWGRALEINPNQYIYRRRIEQYGPRLMKPYSFYDWVARARKDIVARGEKPVKLPVEPDGAELAGRSRDFGADSATVSQPDQQGRILRDKQRLVRLSTVTVPAKARPGRTVRLHLEFVPDGSVHWNNEASPAQVWLNQPDGWLLEKRLFELKQPPEPESSEPRRMELEAKLPKNAKDTTITGYALYYICENAGGSCMFLRRDFKIPIRVARPKSRQKER